MRGASKAALFAGFACVLATAAASPYLGELGRSMSSPAPSKARGRAVASLGPRAAAPLQLPVTPLPAVPASSAPSALAPAPRLEAAPPAPRPAELLAAAPPIASPDAAPQTGLPRKTLSLAAPSSVDGSASAVPAPNAPQADGHPIILPAAVPTSLDADLRQLLPARRRPPKAPRTELRRLRPVSAAARAALTDDPVAQKFMGEVRMPVPSVNIAGMRIGAGGDGNSWPPDPIGDVGRNHYIQAVNTAIQIFDKSGTSLAGPISLDTFFQAADPPSPCSSSNMGDPVVLYDEVADRWLVSDFAWTSNSGPFYQCIGVSKTGDPVAGGWWLYALRAHDRYLTDYPKLGVWGDGYYMTANLFDIATQSQPWIGARVWALNRDDLINGRTPRAVAFDPPNEGGLLPANVRGTPPPAGSSAVFLDLEFNPPLLHLWRLRPDWTTLSNSTFSTTPAALPIAAFTASPTTFVPQPPNGATLDPIDDRLMMQLQYRRVGAAESLWVNHTVINNGVRGIRWYEVRDPNGTPSVHQQGTYQPDALHRWMGSLAVDRQGNMALGYSVSSSSEYPSIRYAGRMAADPAGQLSQGESTVIAGTGAQVTFQRWGDYSAMTIDPVDQCTFWFTSQYLETSGVNWQTRIASFKFPGCRAPAANDFNSDGQSDLVWHNRVTGEIVFWLMNGNTISSEVRAAGPGDRNWLVAALADMNGDTWTDLVWRNGVTGANQVWLMNGTARYQVQSLPAVTDTSWSIAAAVDFNRDSKPDLLWRNRATGEVVLWYMQGAAYAGFAWVAGIADLNWTIAGAADFNGDQRADVVWRNTSTGQNLVWLMDGATYVSYQDLPVETDTSWAIIALTDANANGTPDLIWHNATTGENRVTYLNGSLDEAGTSTLPALTDGESDAVGVAVLARPAASDFNADGTPDIVWHNNSTGATSVWYMGGSRGDVRLSEGNVPVEAALDWRTVATGDFNADGLPDIVWRNQATGENRIWLMTGRAHTGDMALPTIPDANWKVVGVGDFNQDGHPDLAWRNYATGANIIWFLENGVYADWTAPPTITDTNWQIVAVGDFNGDGWPDLFWRNQATGVNIAWKIVGAGDFNGDGKADLLWRNATDGRNLYWYLNDGAYLDFAWLPTLALSWTTGASQ